MCLFLCWCDSIIVYQQRTLWATYVIIISISMPTREPNVNQSIVHVESLCREFMSRVHVESLCREIMFRLHSSCDVPTSLVIWCSAPLGMLGWHVLRRCSQRILYFQWNYNKSALNIAPLRAYGSHQQGLRVQNKLLKQQNTSCCWKTNL